MRRTLRIISLVLIVTGSGVLAYGQGPSGQGSVVNGQGDRVVQRLFLVGDAGELTDGHHPVCDWLKQHVDWNDTSNVLVYLGDNIYPHGMPSEGSTGLEEAKKILDYQLSVVAGKKARAFFVPGNHDWKQGKPGGWQQVKNEEDYIESLGMANVEYLPKEGCPGPVAVPIGDKVVLVGMDSQWWLQDEKDRPGGESGCACKNEKDILNALKDIISTYPDKLIVLAMHHPLYTHGIHGGYYTIKQHIFPLTDLSPGLWIPLPLIGSIYPITRGVFGNVQDVHNPRYKDLREQVESVINGHPNVVHVAGHEHGLQLLQHDSIYYVVSGAGSKNTRVKMGKYSLMAKEDYGFSVIEVRESGKSDIRFYTADAKDLGQTFYTASIAPLQPKPDVQELVRTWPDSVMVVADSQFVSAGGFKRWLLGSNYRKEWSVPVKVPVFNMSGWTPLERGGGLQTRSLRMKNEKGEQYVLRGVKKYITSEALPEAVREDALAKDVVTDGVSSSYPYAALSVPPFASAVNVPHATPKLVYVPDDPRLGKFRADYGNLFAFVEEREPGNGKKTSNTDDLQKKIMKDNDNVVDQRRVLKARLLDMFIMDFDRHEDQWRWEADDNGKGKIYAPVPRDRDQPFFINNGFIPWIAGFPFVAPQLQGFRPKARNIKTFNFNARNFDRNYLNDMSEKDWRDIAEVVLAAMTDSLIETSLKEQPGPIQPYAMNSIIAELKERRKYYIEDVMTYYRFLAKQVSVFGSDKRELFDIVRAGDSVTVTVYKINKSGEKDNALYQRTFQGGLTSELRLYGMGGDDEFRTHGEGGGGIVVRIIGGAGNDVFKNEATSAAVKTKIYDLSTEKNVFEGQGHYREFLSSDPDVNAVNRLGYKYNVLTPLLNVGYNPDDGVFLGVQFRYVTQGFHKDPYKQMHNLSLLHALSTDAWAFKYGFEAIHAIGTMDLLVHANILAPSNTINFFGFGNKSKYDKTAKEGIRYYRARFNSYDADLQLRKRFGNVFSLAIGPAFQYYTLDSTDNKDRFINRTDINGLNKAELYLSKAFLGGRATAVVDTRNDKILTSRGINWVTQFSSYGALNDNSHNYSQLNSDLSLYASFNTRANVVLSTRVGYGKTFGNYEFYQAQFLGGLENLRGYRKFRFAGDESFFHNIDLRVKLAEFQTYLFPGSLGLLFFNDVGRVWRKGENSSEWHDGYGGGLWISPLKKFVFSASYGQGTDGGVVLIKLGFQY
jgi:hypothetical protein